MKNIKLFILAGFWSLYMNAQNSPQTEIKYLSGRGCDDMVQWDFYCTDGLNSDKWTKIGVPSCWETQGFGTVQYGYMFNYWNMAVSTEHIADEIGYYKHHFLLPKEWQGRQIEIIFEASMTDTEVKVNGSLAGEIHQGGFSPFRYDVTDKIKFDDKENLLEVKVSKESSNHRMNLAERRCDFWNFGGIIRPVYLVSKPKNNVERVAIDAKMDGRFTADCFTKKSNKTFRIVTSIMDSNGKVVAENIQAAQDSTRIDFKVNSPNLWTAETPNLYNAMFTLTDNKGHIIHKYNQRFGFRTIEVREGEGIFINGNIVKFKGVNRHSFRSESGRTLSKAKNIEDVLLIKSMNMNAVRLSHYPADPEFYEACDSLGLYVLDEVTGWQNPQETPIGIKLVKEMVTRDVNYPSVVIWDSGNEGGFNYELEPTFARYDIQKRTVIYPWSETRNGINTRHYRSYDETKKYLEGKDIFMPTEFLHGAYDGGHGAGLYDYWQLMKNNNLSAGGFLWDLADAGLIRQDRNGELDCAGNWGPDGIVGPHHEKEGSYYTIKQIWSPIQIINTPTDGKVELINYYDFLNLNTCKLKYHYLRLPKIGKSNVLTLNHGTVSCPNAQPYKTAPVNIPINNEADVLELTVIDYKGDSLFTWSYPISAVAETVQPAYSCKMTENDDKIVIENGTLRYQFSKYSGMLKGVEMDGKKISFANGPRFIAARRSDRDKKNSSGLKASQEKNYRAYLDDATFIGFTRDREDRGLKLTAQYKNGYLNQSTWTFLEDGSVKLDVVCSFNQIVDLMGIMFDYPEELVKEKAWVGNGPFRVWQNRLHGPQYGYWQNEYNDAIPGMHFVYPEFKGYFSHVDWMQLTTTEGRIGIKNLETENYVGIYQPRDGSDNFLYNLPYSGISILKYIPAVRNKVDYTDLNGPSAQPHIAKGEYKFSIILNFGL